MRGGILRCRKLCQPLQNTTNRLPNSYWAARKRFLLRGLTRLSQRLQILPIHTPHLPLQVLKLVRVVPFD